jgi:lipoprotein-anchoring transpeptidase ErfK/SrfK
VKKTFARYRSVIVTLLILFNVGMLGLYVVPQFQRLQEVCANSLSCIQDLRGAYDTSQQFGEFQGRTVYPPAENTFAQAVEPVLGSTTAPKRIAIDLTTQHLYAYEGDNVVMDFPISSGKWGKTPTGTFHIWIKLKYTRMTGGNKAIGTYYNLPNVPNTMYFYNETTPKYLGYGIHAAYWHNNFGHPMSHGCINEPLDMAEKLYNWAEPVSTGSTTQATEENPGTEVTIFGTPPNS